MKPDLKDFFHRDFVEDLWQVVPLLLKDGHHATVLDNLYAAMCNMRWKHSLSGTVFSTSWRCAGGLVADIVNEMGLDPNRKGNASNYDYLDYYCCGNEGIVTDFIEEVLATKGWVPYPYED